jgi:monoamine oxidase
VEGEPVGNLYFAGEHCSADFQGYMEGAAETGVNAAMMVLKAL